MQWQNPLKIPSRSVKSVHYGGGAINYAATNGSTTDIVNYTIRDYVILTTTARKQTLLVNWSQTIAHSVASARFSLAVRVYSDATATTTLSTDLAYNLTAQAVAGQFGLYSFVASFDLDFMNAAPGEHLIYLMLGNITAGTLTFGEPSSTDSFGFILMSQGLKIR